MLVSSLATCVFVAIPRIKKEEGGKETKGVPIGSSRAHLEINVNTLRISGVRAHKVSRARRAQVHASMLGAQQIHPPGDLLGAVMPKAG